jgi:hypothetical protein
LIRRSKFAAESQGEAVLRRICDEITTCPDEEEHTISAHNSESLPSNVEGHVDELCEAQASKYISLQSLPSCDVVEWRRETEIQEWLSNLSEEKRRRSGISEGTQSSGKLRALRSFIEA